VREASGRRIEAVGERAVLVTLGERLDPIVNAHARRLSAAFETHRLEDPRFGRSVPAAASVLVPFDPLAVDPAEAARIVTAIADGAEGADGTEPSNAQAETDTDVSSPIEVPVRYGGRDGPDLSALADTHGLRPADIVELHSGSAWTVLFLGFAPGFAYLGPLPPELATARRATPRERVPAGSVAIGGDQTAVYPFELPGGWQVIGRTDVAMWDLARTRPNLLAPGDRVRFVPIR
jgi:KipI family sensor histidine kinase inhibitor